MTRINERAAPTSKTGDRHFILGIRKPLDLRQLTRVSFGLMRLRSNASSPALTAFAMNHGAATMSTTRAITSSISGSRHTQGSMCVSSLPLKYGRFATHFDAEDHSVQFSLVSVCDEGPRRALKNSVYLFFRLPKRNIDEAFVRRVVDHAHDSFTIGDQMNIKRILACLAMAALLAASKATPAMADVDANDPELAAKSLGSEELGLFEAYSAVANVISSPKSYAPADSLATQSTLKGMTPAQLGTLASGCWNTSSWVIGTNAFGGWLYKLTVSGGWCGNGSSATRSWFNGTWGETFAIGWRDNGQVSSHAVISGGSAKIVGQREFKLGVGGWDVSSPRPCVRIIGHGNGQKGDDQSCSPW